MMDHIIIKGHAGTFAAYMAKDQARWAEVVKRAGARLD